ncbi:hypothetical protein GC163_16945 [bacterium]|nr:hypothetical protein [bacterium]
MDAQHRHQLQHNALQDLTLQTVPWLEKYGKTLVIGVVSVLLLVVAGAVWLSSADATHEAAWTKLSTATTVDEFGLVSDSYPGTLAGVWAQLRSAELTLESGIAAMFTDRELALADLKSSRENFEAVLKSSISLPDNIRERAMLGLARCLEATCDGQTEPVIEAYQKLNEQFPNSAYKKVVEDKIVTLKSADAAEFYAWFHEQTPKPAAFPRPNDGGGTLPGGNPFEFPIAPAKPAEESTTPTEETPAEAAKPESTETPSDPPATEATPEAPAQPE